MLAMTAEVAAMPRQGMKAHRQHPELPKANIRRIKFARFMGSPELYLLPRSAAGSCFIRRTEWRSIQPLGMAIYCGAPSGVRCVHC